MNMKCIAHGICGCALCLSLAHVWEPHRLNETEFPSINQSKVVINNPEAHWESREGPPQELRTEAGTTSAAFFHQVGFENPWLTFPGTTRIS